METQKSNLLLQIEKIVKKPAEEFDEETMKIFEKSESILTQISSFENFSSFAEEMKTLNKNFYEKFLEDTLGIFSFINEKRKVNEILKEFNEDKDIDKMKNNILEEHKKENCFSKFVTFLPILTYFSNEEISQFEDDLRTVIRNCEKVLLKSNIENSFLLLSDYLELFFLYEETFFEKTEKKLLDERKNVIELNEKRLEFSSKLEKEIREKNEK